MAISDTVQTLSAAFSFGILLQAATGSLFLYWRGHGSTIFQDGRRLVLVLFLMFAALWAQIDFVNLLLPTTSTSPCQGTLIFSTVLDQLARVAMEQFLLWSVGKGTKLTAERLVLQIVLLLRLVAGGILAGITRPQFAPLCLARTSILPVGIVVLGLDAFIIALLFIRALSLGMFADIRGGSASPKQEQSKALILSIVGLTVWTGTSVPMILGIPKIILILRTLLPANGLIILVGIVTVFPGALLLAREAEATTPEASSPFITPMPLSRELFRENVGVDGSPVTYSNKANNLFVVNPSDSPTTVFQGNSRRNSRGFTKLGEEITVQELNREGPQRPARPDAKSTPGYRGSSGVFPTLLIASGGDQGAIAPQIRPTISVKTLNISSIISGPMNLSATTPQKRGGLFGFSKTSTKPSIRSLEISQPVPVDSAQPAPRMQTIDLATAANNERERREGAAARARLAASRPVQQAPLFSTQEALQRSVSTKRKQPPPSRSVSEKALPSIAGSVPSGNSLDANNGSSTSASLSPGREDVRRRSPRSQEESFNALLDEKFAAQPTLQRKQTLGLPSNPRASRLTHQPEMNKGPTIMLMNNIVYDDPSMVKTIIGKAPGMYSASKEHGMGEKSVFSVDSISNNVKSSVSIIHRPRPYKRDPDKNRALFPSEHFPGPRRPKSSGSMIPRKSVLMSNPGSPSALPPLPKPPRTAADLKRLLPNDTKSMTFDEKIQLLFPAPPNTKMYNRRSSVPSLPRVPSVFIADKSPTQSLTEEEQQSRRASKRTTIASFGLIDLHIEEKSPKRFEEPQTYRFSANTYRTLADDLSETWLPGIPDHESKAQDSILVVPERQSITNNFRNTNKSASLTSAVSSHDSSSFWVSMHSEIPPVNLSRVMQTAQQTYIGRSTTGRKDSPTRPPPDAPQIDTDDHVEDGKEIMTVMLDSEEARRSLILTASTNNRRSFFLEEDEEMPGKKTEAPRNSSWHCRIGDELPTFSERPTQRSRKMPPPTPLLLNRTGRQATVVVRPPEPSPPVDSPERALQEIQAQLKRFEEPSRDSVRSLLRHFPDANSSTKMGEQTDGLLLLENLEAEMGQQETNWQQMQRDLDQDSMSVVMTPQKEPEAPSESDLSRESSQRSSRRVSRVVTRRARIRSSMAEQSKGEDTSRSNSTQSSENSGASVWQQRLADAQMVYLENAPELLRQKSLNFLSVSKAQLGSPTPPESVDSESEIETEFDSENEDLKNSHLPVETQKDVPSLWEVPPSSPRAAAGRMWNAPYEMSTVRTPSPEPPAKDVRPKKRRTESTLPLFTSELWTKPPSAEHGRPVSLWGSRLVRPRSIVTRRTTQRPQRKSRRMTFLADIVESPQPLPNKREKLGIFQFPWGETSDQPVYQPDFNPALLVTGPALNAKLDARSRELEPSEYSSSFFDYYEEDGEDENNADSDDDFDETTLWEIASLLRSKEVPSKASLLPPARPNIIEDYDLSDPEGSEIVAAVPMVYLPIQPLAMPTQEDSKQFNMWAKETDLALIEHSGGLPQPEPSVWNALLSSSNDIVRSKPQASAIIPSLLTKDLWAFSEPKASEKAPSAMWAGMKMITNPKTASTSPLDVCTPMWKPANVKPMERQSGLFSVPSDGIITRTTQENPAAIMMVKAARPSEASLPIISSKSLWEPEMSMKNSKVWTDVPRKQLSVAMWTPLVKNATVAVTGLFNVSAGRDNYRSSSLYPAALNVVRKPRNSHAPLSQLTSTKLWRGREKQAIEHHWISESSVRPESPTVYSTTSSGNSSPLSDASSIKSTSTKASSIWPTLEPAALKMSTRWDPKKGKKLPTSPKDEEQHRTKIPVRQQAPKGLAPVRESRVLASRDLWEAKAPILNSTLMVPARRFRKVVSKPAIPSLPPHRAIRHQYLPIVAFCANWEEALAEAIAAGSPERSMARSAASKLDWQLALSEAISRSTPRMQRVDATPAMWQLALSAAVAGSQKRAQRINATPEMWAAALAEATPRAIAEPTNNQQYDASVLHPVFFTKTLISTSNDIHPAAIGHVIKVQVYDPAVLHPVFFTESLKTESNDIHPAAIGHITKPQVYDPAVLHPVFFTKTLISTSNDVHPAAIGHVTKPQVYNPAILHPVFFTESLKTESKDIHPAAIGHVIKAQVYDPAVLHPVFFTKSLVSNSQDVHPAATGYATKKGGNGLMWSAPSATPFPQASLMWSEAVAVSRSSPATMKLAGDALRKKFITRSLELPVLKSSHFWQPTTTTSGRLNWLSTMKPQSGIWRASSVNVPRTSGPLWDKHTAAMRSTEPAMQPGREALRKTPVVRIQEPATLESKELWQPTQRLSTERNWLSPAPTMWSAPSTPVSIKSGPLWVNGTPVAQSTVPSMKLSGDALRKAPVVRSLELPVLESKEFWHAAQPQTIERNWLFSEPAASSEPSVPSNIKVSSHPLVSPKSAMFSEPAMWSAPEAALPVVSSQLWSKNQAASHAPEPATKLSGEPLRKAFVTRSLEMPTLESKTFWQQAEKLSATRNWLEESKASAAYTWAPRPASTPMPANGEVSMWQSVKGSASQASPDLFARVKCGYLKQPSSRTEPMPRLTSNKLFEKTSVSESTRNWIQKSSIAPPARLVDPTNPSLTWTAPLAASAASTLPASSMWEAHSQNSSKRSIIFSNAHEEPWNRKKRDIAEEANALQSTELWRLSMALPESPRNWLVERKFSKVEFRY